MTIMDVLLSWLTGDMGFMAVLLWFVQQFMAAQ
ncbi:hypothetical protein LCGC14_1504630 [marine sediment metagenome]|uniref:Uncharacterized protein n=1 Tax=marine sediment metagenome TaxID=412755 RepID=A0A0F9JNU5_9ZZZZ